MCSLLMMGTPPVMPYRRWQPLTQLGQRLGAMSNCRAIQYEESRELAQCRLDIDEPGGPFRFVRDHEQLTRSSSSSSSLPPQPSFDDGHEQPASQARRV